MRSRPALVLLSGEPPSIDLLRAEAERAHLVYVADGAAKYARRAGVRVDRIIGDLDSIREDTKQFFEARHIEIEYKPDQYSNDFEKALRSLLQVYDGPVRVLGAFGRRADHTLTNLSVQLRAMEWFPEIVAVDDEFEHFFLTGARPRFFSESLKLGSLVSLSPYGTAIGVTTRNLQYPLDNADMHVGRQEGLSNRVQDVPVEVSLKSGTLLVSIERQ